MRCVKMSARLYRIVVAWCIPQAETRSHMSHHVSASRCFGERRKVRRRTGPSRSSMRKSRRLLRSAREMLDDCENLKQSCCRHNVQARQKAEHEDYLCVLSLRSNKACYTNRKGLGTTIHRRQISEHEAVLGVLCVVSDAASLGLEPAALLGALPAPWDQLFGSGLLHPDFESPAPLVHPHSVFTGKTYYNL